MNTDCPICGHESEFLGTLGHVVWLRCIACGMDWHTPWATPRALSWPECDTPDEYADAQLELNL